FERGWTEPGFEKYCDNVDGFRALAFAHGVAGWCEDADVSPAAAEDIARRLHEVPAAILVGWGMARRVNGGAIVRALDALCAISGNLGVPGGGVSYYFKRRKTFDHAFIRGIAAGPRTVLEALFGPEVLAFRDPPIRAVWITAGNPVAMLPESATVDRALRTREFVCVVDSWPTDTTRAATLVLPTTTLLEADDLVGAYGHHWVGSARPVVPPPPGVKSDLQILQELSARVGLDGVLDGTARDWKERILRKDAAAGIPDGAFAHLESALGTLPIRVRHDPRQRRDVALLAKGGHLRENRNANVLSKARATDLGGGGALYDEPVRLKV